MIYGIHDKTIAQKVFVLLAQLVELIIAFILVMHIKADVQRIVIICALLIVFLRLNAMMFIWLPRGLSWQEAMGNSFAFALYYIGFPCLAMYASDVSLWCLVGGGVLFVVGSAINTISELLRKPFKDNPANVGKLYTGGLFHYAVHINYFGDVLWVLGFALMTGNLWALLIPASLLLIFMFSYIPTADRYLEKHYGKDFDYYRAKTAELIPFIW